MHARAILTLLLLLPFALLTLPGCESGPRFPMPHLAAGGVSIAPGEDAADVELVARNPTDAPMWLRRMEIELEAGDRILALGLWEGDRSIDPGAAVLFPLRLPLTEGQSPPPLPAPARLHIHARYARSGIIGVLGGETHTYTLQTVISPAAD